ncbi:hypothetical protein EV426DRAFT_720992 [Tirmania nivea]|nr:hypothetical protein EV426DRAFT_720992 [Tirmania nivea]
MYFNAPSVRRYRHRSAIRIYLTLKQFYASVIPMFNNVRTYTTSAALDTKYREGQHVEYRVHKRVRGRENMSISAGIIVRVLTWDTLAGSSSVVVQADADDPIYEIRNDQTGTTSAINEEHILKVLY